MFATFYLPVESFHLSDNCIQAVLSLHCRWRRHRLHHSYPNLSGCSCCCCCRCCSCCHHCCRKFTSFYVLQFPSFTSPQRRFPLSAATTTFLSSSYSFVRLLLTLVVFFCISYELSIFYYHIILLLMHITYSFMNRLHFILVAFFFTYISVGNRASNFF